MAETSSAVRKYIQQVAFVPSRCKDGIQAQSIKVELLDPIEGILKMNSRTN
ncbi:MAG TPA: hypothetical protein VIX90_01685 [Edaphobacter sp.]